MGFSKKTAGIALACVFLALMFAPAFAVLPRGEMKIYAVTTEGEGLVAKLDLQIENGSGKVWSAVTPLVGTATQKAEKTAVKVAGNYFPNADKHDYKFTIESSAAVVDGPSAGAAMALLTVLMLGDKPLAGEISITGTVSEDGRVGPVGGIFEKAREASRNGTKLFLIPKGEAIQTVKLPEGVRSINIIEYAPKNWGLKVVEVQAIDDALRLAESKIEDIDVNASATEAILEFVPEKLAIGNKGNLAFKALVTNYLKKTKQGIAEARNALSASLIEDGQITHELVEILNNSEQTLGRADVLNEQNYLYSAANFAFLARVNAIIVHEVSANPKLLDPDSASLDMKLVELRRELSTFENEMDGEVPIQGVEWFVSSQQRFMYAKNTIEKLSREQTVVIVGEESDKRATALKKLQDYAFAVAWLDVSKDFYSLSTENNAAVKRPNAFADAARMKIAEADSAILDLGPDATSKEDITRRLEAAKASLDINWTEASLFDAASALALARAENDLNGIGYDKAKKKLEGKISSIEKKFSDSNYQTGWAELYLQHAKYFLASAEYYEKANLKMTALEGIKSGYSLALLSEEEFAVASKVKEHYSKLTPTERKNGGNGGSDSAKANGQNAPLWTDGKILGLDPWLAFAFIFAFAFTCLTIGVGATLLLSSRGSNKPSVNSEIAKCKKMLAYTDEKFISGGLGREDHNSLKRRYEQELARLENERKAKTENALAIDSYASDIGSMHSRITALRRRMREDMISPQEFAARSKEYAEKIGELKEKLDSEINKSSMQDATLTKIEEPMPDKTQGKETSQVKAINHPKKRVTKNTANRLKAEKQKRKDGRKK